MTDEPLILASASPRRRELLRLLGLPFEVVPSAFEEPAPASHPDPEALARELALAKARDVARNHPRRWVLGADTVVWLGDRLLGKPADASEAAAMLAALVGRTHRVTTGLALLRRGGPELTAHATTEVTFRPLTPREVAAYVATGEPYDKAGGYGIQGHGALLVEGVRGDYPNVVGLPLVPLLRLLRAAGLLPSP